MSSTSSSSDTPEENESSRVLGIGGGTFTVFMLALVVVLVWMFTEPMKFGIAKRSFRGLSVTLFVIVFLILLLSDREPQYKDEGEKIESYDSSIVPRIAVSSMMILSALWAMVVMIFLHTSKVITQSSQDVDSTALW